jgi:hypothetical protein
MYTSACAVPGHFTGSPANLAGTYSNFVSSSKTLSDPGKSLLDAFDAFTLEGFDPPAIAIEQITRAMDQHRRKNLRDRAIRAAISYIKPSAPYYERRRSLENEIRRFARAWPRLSKMLPPQITDVRSALHVAFATGLKIPTSRQSLDLICKSVSVNQAL